MTYIIIIFKFKYPTLFVVHTYVQMDCIAKCTRSTYLYNFIFYNVYVVPVEYTRYLFAHRMLVLLHVVVTLGEGLERGQRLLRQAHVISDDPSLGLHRR